MKAALADVYQDYIACLNRQDWSMLDQFVQDDVWYNGSPAATAAAAVTSIPSPPAVSA